MADIIKPILLDETGKQMIERLDRQNAILSIIAADKKQAMYENMAQIADIVRGNTVDQNAVIFPVGSKITVPWVDKSNNKEYTMPFNVVHHKLVELADGSIVPGMIIQSHYATPYGVQFSHNQAFYYASAVLPAGDYKITLGTTWGNKECVAGTIVSFTLTSELPVGGRLCGMYGLPDQASSAWKIYAYAADGKTLLETMNATVGDNGGTSLGTMYSNRNDEGLNFMQQVAYGYNRWSQAAIRQWLNSEAAADNWWMPQSDYDIVPDQANKPGFLSGFDADFLSAIRAIKVQTAANTLTDGGVTDVTYDKFFCPSLEEIFTTPQIKGIEGEAWNYWKQALRRTTPTDRGVVYPEYIHYALENHASAQYVRLRSAYRGAGSNAWYVDSTGSVTGYYAYYAHRCAPACAIC